MLRSRVGFVGIVAAVLALSGFTTGDAFDVRHIFAAAGVALIVLTYRKFDAWHSSVVKWQDRVDSALWGPEDANGKRNVEAGVVVIVTRLSADLPRLAIATQDAARSAHEAARAAQTAEALMLSMSESQRQDLHERHK